jgi:NDP-sugar pyrophosphorylase family protein
VDVAVLAGGLGTRIQGVLGDTPKIMAPINGRCFLDHLITSLESFGARRIVLCLGHLASEVVKYIESRNAGTAALDYVVEPRPLGTGGALCHALPRLHSADVLVLNGDTWLEIDQCEFLDHHRREAGQITLACASVTDAGRYGRVELDHRGRVIRFVEKDETATGPARINGGAYLFTRSELERLAAANVTSLEQDYLQRLKPGSISAYACDAAFVDIGTPESLAAAGPILSQPLANQGNRDR